MSRAPETTFSSVHTQSFASGRRQRTPPGDLGHPGNVPPSSSARSQQLLLDLGSPGATRVCWAQGTLQKPFSY